MKYVARCCIALLLLAMAVAGTAQPKVSAAGWDSLVTALRSENWKTVEQLSSTYLLRYPDSDTTAETPTLRYMLLRGIAGQLATKKYSAEQAMNKALPLKGKSVLTPTLTFCSKGIFNTVKLADNGMALFICGANNKATEIHTFEYYTPTDTAIMSSIGALEEKPVRLYAIITDIKTTGVTFPHLEVMLAETEVLLDKK